MISACEVRGLVGGVRVLEGEWIILISGDKGARPARCAVHREHGLGPVRTDSVLGLERDRPQIAATLLGRCGDASGRPRYDAIECEHLLGDAQLPRLATVPPPWRVR